MSAEDDLALLAQRVRELYWAARCNYELASSGLPVHTRPVATPRWDGGTDKDGRRHQPVWPKIALALFNAGVAPEAAIRGVFGGRGRAGTSAPLPTALLRPDVAELAAAQVDKDHRHTLARVAAERVSARVRIAVLTQTTSLADAEICRRVILAGDLSLSPLLRLCLARQTYQHDLEEGLEEAAFFQYITCPAAYTEALGQHIPTDFPNRLESLQAFAKGGRR